MTKLKDRVTKRAEFRLRKRREFVLLREEGRFFSAKGVAIQTLMREGEGEVRLRFGVTASRKVGNAVKRNRAKRRLRALWRGYEGNIERGWDVNMIASGMTCRIPWKVLQKSFRYLMKKEGLWKLRGEEEKMRRKDA